MRRVFFTAIASSALVVSAPSIASASHHSKSCHRAHHAKHSSCATRARLLRFGSPLPVGAAGSVPSSSAPADTPSGPTTPSTGEEPAGIVKSFEEGVLVITLKDKSTVSGRVTSETEIRCSSASSSGSDDEGEEGDRSSEDGGRSPDGSSAFAGHDARAASNGSDGSDGEGGEGDDHEGATPPCTTAALTPGATVREAELSLSSSGAVWDHVELVE